MKTRLLVTSLCALVLGAPFAMAQHSHPGSNSPAGMDMSMTQELGPPDQNYDLRFIEAMIVHHEGALAMAQDALGKSRRPEVQKLSRQIIASQRQEIEQMKYWKKIWYNR